MGFDSQKPDQATLIIQRGFVPEPKLKMPENLLTEDNVNNTFDIFTSGSPKKVMTFPFGTVSFNENALEDIKKQDIVLAFGDQVSEEFLYNEETNTYGALMKNIWFIDKNHQAQWTYSEEVRNKLVSMMLAIKLARDPSSNTVRKLGPPNERDNFYLLVNKGAFLKERARKEYVYGKAK